MLRVFILPLSLCSLLVVAASHLAQASILTPDGEKHTIQFARDGQAIYRIILPAAASTHEQDAANQLKRYLDQITGASFDLMNDDMATPGPYISVGMTTQAKQQASLQTIAEQLTGDALAIQVIDGNIHLLGLSRGITHAAVALLEEDLGCRWYSHQWTHIPSDRNLTAAVTSRLSKPAFDLRMVYTASVMSSDPDWTRHNRVMAWNRFNHIEGWFAHTYSQICAMSEFKDHPELFALDAQGKPFNTALCPTHPQIIQRAQERSLAALRRHYSPEHNLISISEYDGSTGYCHCDRCQAINKKHGSPIAAHLTLVNEVAKTIAPEFPDAKVTFLVYSRDFRQPPRGIRMLPNVAMWYCSNDVPFEKPYEKMIQASRQFEQWRAIVNITYVWEYCCDYSRYFRVLPTLPAKIDNLRYWHRHNVSGVMLLEVFGSPAGDQQALRAWMLAKLLWNPQLDTDALAKDFCDHVFGIASDEMMAYYRLVQHAGKQGRPVETVYGLNGFIRQAQAIFDRALSKADALHDTELRQRIEVHQVSVSIMELDQIFDAWPDNASRFPRQRYDALLASVQTITQREAMLRYSELRSMQGRLAEWRMLADASQTGVLGVRTIDATLYEYPRCNDPLAEGGEATRLPPNDNWLVQWHFPTNLCLPGKRYQLRAHLRKGRSSGQDKVAVVGVHDKQQPDRSFQRHLDDRDLSHEAYQWVNIGQPFTPQPGQYVWFAAAAGSGIDWLYVDRVELLPVD